MKITRADVEQAAKDSGIGCIEAITLMQSAATKIGDEFTLERLCDIKWELLEEWQYL